MKNYLNNQLIISRALKGLAKEQESWVHIEFEIICIDNSFPKFAGGVIIDDDTSRPKIGQKFKINNYEYNYAVDYIRLPVYGLLPRSNFMKIEEYRNQKINDLLN